MRYAQAVDYSKWAAPIENENILENPEGDFPQRDIGIFIDHRF